MEQTFGSYVREKRMARGLSLRGLAAKLEVSPVYMSNMENDRRPAPTKEKMDRLIEIHDVLRQVRGHPLRFRFGGQIQQQFRVCLA